MATLAATTDLVVYPIRGITEYRGDLLERLAGAWLIGYGPATRSAYRSDLRDWLAWLERFGVEPLDAGRAHVDAYARQLEDDGRSRATIARRLATLSGFYAYALDEGHVRRNPVARVRRPKIGRDSQTLGLDRGELGALIDAAGRSSARDYALACLLATNGVRISEALKADADQLGQERGHRTLAILRKGSVRATIPLAPMTADALDRYLAGRSMGPLFATASGRRMDRQAAGKVIRRLARQAGIAKTISPHSLRHTFVTLALDSGASLRDVQDAAGHADPRTTRRYDRGRHNLDRHPTYAVAATIAEMER